MNILVVDDIEINRNLLRAMLTSEGYVVAEAADGVEALEVLERESMDAVISDILMPRMDGYRFCHEVRSSERLRALPFVFYTATYTSKGDEALCMELGADRYLRKPASPEVLLAALDDLIRNPPRRDSTRPRHDETSLMKEYSQRLVDKLEEKNAELSTTLAVLRASEERLQTIIRAEPECVKVISPEGLILDMNPAGLAMFEADSIEQLRGRAILDFVAPAYREPLRELHERVFAGGTGSLAFETIGLRGTRCWLETKSVPLLEHGKISALLGIARDGTATRAAQIALRVSESRYRRLVNSGEIGVMIARIDGRIIEANDCLLRMLGYTRDEFQSDGLRWDQLTPPEWSEADRAAIDAAIKFSLYPAYDKEYFGKDGSRIPVQFTVVAPDDVAGNFLCLVADIRERKRAESEMRMLSGRLLRAQDEAQRHLARELHDSTAQIVAAIGMNLTMLRSSKSALDARQSELVDRCEALADSAATELRTIAYLLHPPAIESLGLLGAIRDYARGFAQRSGLAVKLELPQSLPRLPEPIELSLFRVVQESLANAYRHSGGETVLIRMAQSATHIELEVCDDGCGPPPDIDVDAAKSEYPGVGVAGMRERVRLLGGSFEIRPARPGTCVYVTLPLNGDTP